MERYIEQLLTDIQAATNNVSWPFPTENLSLHDWISDKEEEKTAPTIQLEEWTGIRKEQLPPAEMLSDDQVTRLLDSLNNMLNQYNWSFVLQTTVPGRIQYETIRINFDQEAKMKRWHLGVFQLCKEGTEHGECTLGDHCQCRFYHELLSGFEEDTRSPEEIRAAELDIEVNHIKRKYGDGWMKYYPYHLDPDYDDENGNPYNYGFGDTEDDPDGDWWKK